MTIGASISLAGDEAVRIQFTEALPHPLNNTVAHALMSAGHVRSLQWHEGKDPTLWEGGVPEQGFDLPKIGEILTTYGIEAALA